MEPQNPQNNSNIIPPVQSTIEPENSSFLHSKWLKIGAVIVVALILLGGTYMLGKNKFIPKPATIVSEKDTPTPASNPKADWKNFTSKTFGFSLKYPNNLTAAEYLTPFYLVNFKRTGAAQGEFAVFDLLAAPDTFTAKDPAAYDFLSADVIGQLLSLPHNSMKTIGTSIFKSVSNTIVGGQEATIIDIASTVDTTTHQLRVIFKNYGNTYMFVNYNDDPNQQTDFNNLLSTFKFTNSTSSDETGTIETLVKDFYAKYLAGTPPARNVDQLKTDGYLNDNAVNQIKQTVGADLVTCSQNPLSSNDYVYSTPQINNNTATMNVKGTYSGPPSSTITINLNLIRSGTNWTINSFSCAK